MGALERIWDGGPTLWSRNGLLVSGKQNPVASSLAWHMELGRLTELWATFALAPPSTDSLACWCGSQRYLLTNQAVNSLP